MTLENGKNENNGVVSWERNRAVEKSRKECSDQEIHKDGETIGLPSL